MKRRAAKNLFNIGRWLTDPKLNQCSAQTRGFFFDCLATMARHGFSVLEGTKEELCRLTSSMADELESALDELSGFGVAPVFVTEDRIAIHLPCEWIQLPDRSRHIPLATRRAVLSRGGCIYCGSSDDLTVDHRKAFSIGGTHELCNLDCVCRTCNIRKQTKTPGDFRRQLRRESRRTITV